MTYNLSQIGVVINDFNCIVLALMMLVIISFLLLLYQLGDFID